MGFDVSYVLSYFNLHLISVSLKENSKEGMVFELMSNKYDFSSLTRCPSNDKNMLSGKLVIFLRYHSIGVY